jgi:hypothetical protein
VKNILFSEYVDGLKSWVFAIFNEPLNVLMGIDPCTYVQTSEQTDDINHTLRVYKLSLLTIVVTFLVIESLIIILIHPGWWFCLLLIPLISFKVIRDYVLARAKLLILYKFYFEWYIFLFFSFIRRPLILYDFLYDLPGLYCCLLPSYWRLKIELSTAFNRIAYRFLYL